MLTQTLMHIDVYMRTGYGVNVLPKSTLDWLNTKIYWTYDNLQPGHLNNTNALQKMSVKLPIDIDAAWEIEYMQLVFGYYDATVSTSETSFRKVWVVRVTDCLFVNPNVTRLNFVVDPWITTLMTTSDEKNPDGTNKYPINVWGTIDRVTIEEDLSYNNLIAEPFEISSSDRPYNNPSGENIQQWLNNTIKEIQGDEWFYCVIVSQRTLMYMQHPSGANVFPYDLNPVFPDAFGNAAPAPGVPTLRMIPLGLFTIPSSGSSWPQGATLPTNGFSSYLLRGETVPGVPFFFDTEEQVNDFILAMSQAGWSRQVLDQNTNIITTEFELLTFNDVFSIQYLPKNLNSEGTTDVIPGVSELPMPLFWEKTSPAFYKHNVNWGKLNTYPYNYFKIRTNEGNEINIIPHIHLDNNNSMNLEIIYVGGMNPRLMGRIIATPNTLDGSGLEQNDHPHDDMFTIHSYDILNFSNDNIQATNTQRQLTLAITQKNAMAVGRYGEAYKAITAAIGGASAGLGIGGGNALVAAGGAITGAASSLIDTEMNLGRSLLTNSNAQSVSSISAYNAPNNSVSNLSGNVAANLAQISLYMCGATPFEVEGINAQMKSVGVKVQTYGKQWDGLFNIPNVKGWYHDLEFWKYSNISLMENIRTKYKSDIANLFLSGVYFKTNKVMSGE